jgi:predicted nucleic acid-binding Zn ribbon protein
MQKKRFCKVCGNPFIGDGETCSIECKRTLAQKKRRRYAVKERKRRREERRPIHCIICGKPLRTQGRYCKNHRKFYKREYRRMHRADEPGTSTL